jgi:hypothetical protein
MEFNSGEIQDVSKTAGDIDLVDIELENYLASIPLPTRMHECENGLVDQFRLVELDVMSALLGENL